MEKTKRIAAFAFAIVVLFSAICIPAYANPTEGEYDVIDVTGILERDETSWEMAKPLAGDQSETGYRAIRVGVDQTNTTAYTYQSGNARYVRFVSSIENTNCYIMTRQYVNNAATYMTPRAGGVTKAYTCNNAISYDGGTYYYADCNWDYITTYTTNANYQLPFYSSDISLETANAEACAYLSDSISGDSPVPFSYNVAPGYALFVDIHGLTGLSGSLSTSTSKAFASPHTSNQTLSYQSSLPSGNVSPQGNGITWVGNGNTDLFGRYKSWNRSLIINPNSSYIAIFNPVHIDTYLDPEHEDFNGTIHVSVSLAYAGSSILLPLNTELTASGQVGTTTTDDQKPMEYDPDNDLWYPTNQDGTPYTPSPYGDYMPSTVNSVNDWLQNIANQISGFFSGAIGAVTTLVNAGSAFIHQLISLYSWLPGPVYAVLSSALILVITIGVIKVFI